MRQIPVSCAGIETRAQLHQRLKEALGFPDWYGCNLDALHDLLGEISAPTHLIFTDFEMLPSFRGGFRMVLEDAENENEVLIVTFR